MTKGLTDRLKRNRLTVDAVDTIAGGLRVRGTDEGCSDLSCHDGTVVVTDDGSVASLEALNPGDVVKIESGAERLERIVVLRRVWDELSSPEP